MQYLLNNPFFFFYIELYPFQSSIGIELCPVQSIVGVQSFKHILNASALGQNPINVVLKKIRFLKVNRIFRTSKQTAFRVKEHILGQMNAPFGQGGQVRLGLVWIFEKFLFLFHFNYHTKMPHVYFNSYFTKKKTYFQAK